MYTLFVTNNTAPSGWISTKLKPMEKKKCWFYNKLTLGAGCSFRPNDVLSFSFKPSYTSALNSLQWVTLISEQDKPEYIFGRVKFNQASLELRLNYSITPNLSIQYYCQPFIAAGKYSHFKEITNPMASKYTDRFHQFTSNEIQKDETRNIYQVENEQNGELDYEFQNPDFNEKQLISNLIIRWEYFAGSTIYLVWSQNRSGLVHTGSFDLSDNINELTSLFPHNIFLLKISHRFSF